MLKRFFIAQILLIVIHLSVRGQGEQLVINLSSSGDKRVFTFENPKGSVRITGYDGNDIVINANLRVRETENNPVAGMRRIGQNPLEISARADGNDVTLYCKATGKTVDFDIKIPRSFSLKLKSLDNGKITVINVNGEIEIENPNGDISLENVSGSSVLSSVYGNISAVFREVRPDSPVMLTTFEGDISLDLPVSVNATLKMKSETGNLETDFDYQSTRRQPVVQNVENTKIYSLEDWITVKINGGGPEIIIRTYNGNITIRKKQDFR